MKFEALLKNEAMKVRKNIKLPNINGVFDIYKVQLNELIFNPYNDRFAKEIKTWELEHNQKLGLNQRSQVFLYQLLSSIPRNKVTKKDILKNGLMRKIVVDATGLIIDGNRRVSILRELVASGKEEFIDKFSFVEVVIIPRKLSKDEIDEYETKLQISEDEKVEYDVINMYLKVDKHYKNQSKELSKKQRAQKVANLLGSKYTVGSIQKMIDSFQEMKTYLKTYLGDEHAYSFIEGKEDQFKHIVSLNSAFSNKTVKTDFPLTYPMFKKLKNILYAFVALDLRANPYFRDLVPKKTITKTPLTRKLGIEKIEEKFREEGIDNINKYLLNEKIRKHTSEYWSNWLSKLNYSLNEKNPIIKYEKKLDQTKSNMKDLFKALETNELQKLDEKSKKILDEVSKLIKAIKGRQ